MLRSAALPSIPESVAFVRLRHVSWQHHDLEPNFRDAEAPPAPAARIQVSGAESKPSKYAAYQMGMRQRLATRRSLLSVSLAL